jgi:hypothetical protein
MRGVSRGFGVRGEVGSGHGAGHVPRESVPRVSARACVRVSVRACVRVSVRASASA